MANNKTTLAVDPKFFNQAGGDFHFSALSPTSVTEGGLDLSADFTADKDGVTRTDPWSAGIFPALVDGTLVLLSLLTRRGPGRRIRPYFSPS